ncbi:alpha/beta fold hydrolase [Sphingomonas sp. PB4P5]|uniref:alpha/beta fold hydrolase n=1 Tax=Parasphingomonas puruogangriensis TaxID=3096155 RepID=UPI002FCB647A
MATIRILAAVLLLAASLFQPAHAQKAAALPAAPEEFAPARAIIADVQRIVTPNGIDETLVLELGGARQVVNIRGADRANPILLYIHGGPGSVEMPMAWSFQHPWEDFFTVVQWDQRGAGRSYPLNDPATIAPTLRLERYRDDAIELIEQLSARLGQHKVFVLGHSFGSAVGLAVAQVRPDLLHAYIGMGQLIDFRENERVGMQQTLAIARERGDDEAVQAIAALRPYPDRGRSPSCRRTPGENTPTAMAHSRACVLMPISTSTRRSCRRSTPQQTGKHGRRAAPSP